MRVLGFRGGVLILPYRRTRGVGGIASRHGAREFGQTWVWFIGALDRYCLILLGLPTYYLANSLDNHGGDVGAIY